MPEVQISAETLARLQAHAVPLLDTVDTVIGRLLDGYENRAQKAGTQVSSLRVFNAASPPDLRHTRVLSVEINGQATEIDKWNNLHFDLVQRSCRASRSIEDRISRMPGNAVEGVKTDHGYRPVPGTGLSVQGQDANGAWRCIYKMARDLGCTVRVTFVWREKDGAAFPGVMAEMTV